MYHLNFDTYNIMFYSDFTYSHYENPHNVGNVANHTHEAMIGSPFSGAVIKVTAKVENNTIKDIAFKAYGGGAVIASMSLFTEKIKNQTVEFALSIKSNDLSEELSLEPVKIVYSMMAIDVIHQLFKNDVQKK